MIKIENYIYEDISKILDLDTGLYSAKDSEGVNITIYRQKGSGFKITKVHPNKPKWIDVYEYDEDGDLECNYLEPIDSQNY